MAVKGQAATGTAGAAGGAGIVSQWQTLGSLDWIGDMVPALILVTYLSLLAIAYLYFDLRKRVKALEGK